MGRFHFKTPMLVSWRGPLIFHQFSPGAKAPGAKSSPGPGSRPNSRTSARFAGGRDGICARV